jgi:hypothetical protein
VLRRSGGGEGLVTWYNQLPHRVQQVLSGGMSRKRKVEAAVVAVVLEWCGGLTFLFMKPIAASPRASILAAYVEKFKLY